MSEFILNAENISIRFNFKQYLFKDISLILSTGQTLAIGGHNGSGKSTMLKILMGLQKPSSGKVYMAMNNQEIESRQLRQYFSIVAPYMRLYEEFSAIEHLQIICRFRGIKFELDRALELLRRLKLYKKKDHQIKTYSSGMKQRLQFCIAMISDPLIYFLDEPFSNLDEEGIGIISEIIEELRQAGHGIIIASNDSREKQLCSSCIELGKSENIKPKGK